MSGKNIFHGTSRVVGALLLDLLAGIQENMSGVVRELVDNGVDADATEIVVKLEPTKVTVFDNGHGMNREMMHEDYDTFNAFLEDIAQGRGDTDNFDISTLIPEVSLKTLQYMMEGIALSSKRTRKDKKTKGRKGIGFLGYRAVAARALVTTRPTKRLAEMMYGDSDPHAQHPPVFILEPPDPTKRTWDYSVIEESGTFKDPLGRDVLHGTAVEITEFKNGVDLDQRQADQIIKLLQTRNAVHIRDGLRLVVIGLDGKRTLLKPQVFKGTPILQVERYVQARIGKERKSIPFGIDIWYDASGKDLEVYLVHRDSYIQPISNLQEFDNPVWVSGKLNGKIEFPDVSEDFAPWNPAKTAPLDGDIKKSWVSIVNGELSHVMAQINKEDLRHRDENIDDITRAVADRLPEVMNDVDFFRGVVVGPPTRERKEEEEEKPPRPQRDEDYVIATVFDEHNSAVAGITIELSFPGSRRTEVKVTGASGKISFGKRAQGRYNVRAILPDTITPADHLTASGYRFTLSNRQAGFRAVFRVQTGKPAPEVKRLRKLTIYPHPMSDRDEPYSTKRMGNGVLEINSIAPDYKEAYDADDNDRMITLLAQYTAAALTEFVSQGESSEYLLMQASLLAPKIVYSMKGYRPSRKSRSRKSR